MAATAYKLPYAVHHSPGHFMARGEDVSVTVVFGSTASDKATADAFSLVTAFLHLAKSGALGGAAIPPWSSGIGAIDDGPRTNNSVTWVLRAVVVDDLSIAILAQLFLVAHRAYPIARVMVHSQTSSDQLVQLARARNDDDIYPKLFAPLASRVAISPHCAEDISVEAELSAELSPEESEVVRLHLENCIAAIAIGCYPIAPLPPEECSLQYDRNIRVWERWVDFGLNSFSAHPDALNGLCNALFAALGKGREVLAIEIE